MMELLAAFLIFGLGMLGMSLGVILTGRAIKGSCGGAGRGHDGLGSASCVCTAAAGGVCTRTGETAGSSGLLLIEPASEAEPAPPEPVPA